MFNAADALQGREGAIIKVVTGNQSTSQDDGGGRILIKVSDNGVGIPRENLERVFDPFFTTKVAGSGVGSGLLLCQRMILANHGTIRIDSEIGKGTEVTISLPAHQEALRAEPPLLDKRRTVNMPPEVSGFQSRSGQEAEALLTVRPLLIL